MTIEDISTNAKARALRLKEARETSSLTLREMASTGLINFNTLCGWELAKHGGLTERGALKIVERLRECGTYCSVEWLLYGAGERPSKTIQVTTPEINSTSERVLLHHHFMVGTYPNLAFIQIRDASMTPEFHIGDYVYGFFDAPDIIKISAANGKNVIVQLKSGEIVLRKLSFNKSSNEILLMASNSLFHPPFLYNSSINKISLIFCHIQNDEFVFENEVKNV